MATLRFRSAILALAAAAIVLSPLSLPGGGLAMAEEQAVRSEPLTIASSNGPHAFDVEVMRTEAQRSRGLMYRKAMASDHGMLFNFDAPQTVNMWMKNTYLPLDMVFIRSDGTIARVAADTEPLSTKIISSNEPVLGVLELNAGTAAKLGIKAGDRVQHAMFKGM